MGTLYNLIPKALFTLLFIAMVTEIIRDHSPILSEVLTLITGLSMVGMMFLLITVTLGLLIGQLGGK